MPSSVRDRSQNRGRADTLLLFSALLVTGLVAMGVTLMFTGDPDANANIDRQSGADRTSRDGADATGRSGNDARTGVASPTRRSTDPDASGRDASGRVETAAVVRSSGSGSGKPVRDQGNRRSTSPFGERRSQEVKGQSTPGRTGQGRTGQGHKGSGRDGFATADRSVDAPHAGRRVRSAEQMKRDRARKLAQQDPSRRSIGTNPGAVNPGTTIAARTGSDATLNGSRGNVNGGNVNRGNVNRGNTGVAADGSKTGAADGTALTAEATNPNGNGNGAPGAAEEDLIEYYDPPGYNDGENPETEPTEPEPEPEPEEEEELVDVNGSAYLLMPAETTVGSTIQVPLMVDAGTRYLAAYGLELAWDNSVLSIDSVGAGGGNFDPPFVVNLENDKGQLRFNGISVTPVASGKIPVATLTITVLERPQSGRAQIRPMSGNQTIAVYADDGITPLTVSGATFATATLTIKE